MVVIGGDPVEYPIKYFKRYQLARRTRYNMHFSVGTTRHLRFVRLNGQSNIGHGRHSISWP
jgi:hypothetical protein